jgi:branched-chain amino acid transport system permease protein
MNPSVFADLLSTGILRGGLYALMGVGLALTFGVMNICNFAHGEFYMIGAYLAYFGFVVFGLNPILAILVASLGAFVAGAIVERLVFNPLRKRSKESWVMNAFLVTAGLSIILQNSVQMIFGTRYKGVSQYFSGFVRVAPGMAISTDRAMAFVIAILAIAAFWVFLQRTDTGRAIRAVAQDERGASLVGINLGYIHTLTFALGCGLAGLGGASLLSLSPAYPTVGARPTITAWFVVTVIGLGNTGAAIVGGLIVGILQTFVFFFIGNGWQDLVDLLFLLVLIWFKPAGLFGTPVKGVLER